MGKKPQHTSRQFWIVGIALVVLVVVGIGVVWVDRMLDARKFSDISKDKDTVASGLIDYLGDNVRTVVERDICFNTNQGPYDKGRLWCQVATVVTMNYEVSFEDLGNQFLSVVESNGLSVYHGAHPGSGSQTYAFDVDDGRWCELGYSSKSDRGTSGTRDVLSDVDRPAFAIACAHTAKAKHYEYID